VTAFIPDPLVPASGAALPATSAAEGVAADASGNIYGRRWFEVFEEICEK